jgi:type II secretory pathway pseudopilin PulG
VSVRSEDGMTLVELLVGVMIGMVILLAAFSLVDVTVKSQKRTSQRMEAVARGRDALEVITRQLRSQTCLGFGLAPMTATTGNSVEFYASTTAPPANNGPLRIDRRQLEFVPTAGTRGNIVERVYQPTSGVAPDLVFPGTPTRTRTLVRDVALLSGRPLFRFYKYDAVDSPQMVELTGTIPAADRALIVKVDVGFDSFPDSGGDAKLKTQYQSEVFVRTADPTDPTRSPECI